MEIQLYIRGILADIGDRKEFVRNFKRTLQFSDLENPTKIVTDYSYSINLPGTPTNKRIFGYVDTLGTDLYDFNPAVPYEFILNVNGVMWLKGSVQLTKAEMKSGITTFTCSFYSLQHEMLVRLGNKKLNALPALQENDAYYHYLNRTEMSKFWGGIHPFADVIRYVPTRAGFYADFQNDKFMTTITRAAHDLTPATPDPSSHVEYKTVDVGTDLDEYASREYRIEYQRPAVSVSWLMTALQADNDIRVDASLMQSPYVTYGWMLCPQFNVEAESKNVEGTFPANSHYRDRPSSGYGDTGWNIAGMTQQTAYSSDIFHGTRITPDNECTQVKVECAIRLSAQAALSGSSSSNPIWSTRKVYMRYSSGPYVTFRAEMSGAGFSPMAPDEGTKRIYMSKTNGANEAPYWYDASFADSSSSRNYVYHNTALQAAYPGWQDDTWTPCIFTFTLTPGVHSNIAFLLNMSIANISYGFGDRPYPISGEYTNTFGVDRVTVEVAPITSLNSGDLTRAMSAGYQGVTLGYEAKTSSWSPLYMNMNTIMSNEEMSQRDFLTDFSKMTGCVWDFGGGKDAKDGKVTVVPRNKFFANCDIIDWSDKLDRSSSIEITPITFDKRTYTLSFKDGDSFLENQFKDTLGKDYGMQYVDTGYGFNSDTENLHENYAYNTVMAKGERIVAMLDSSQRVVTVRQTPYEIPMIETKDHGKPKEGHRYLFDCGIQFLEKGEEVYISQDAAYMQRDAIGGRCWMDMQQYSSAPEISNNIVICSAIPFFCTRWKTCSFDWAKPQISYSDETDLSYPEGITLYQRFWSSYLEELYDARNRVVTAYFALDTMDLLTFSFRNFVSVDNHLYHPNKIIDYDITGESLTKVELVEVHNIDAWVNGQDWDFSPNRSSSQYNYDSSGMFKEPVISDEPEEPEESEKP